MAINEIFRNKAKLKHVQYIQPEFCKRTDKNFTETEVLSMYSTNNYIFVV